MIPYQQLTAQQQNCVDYDGKDLLLRGVAGSGKSVVLLARAVKLAQLAKQEGKTAKIAIFTFANSLVKYTTEILDDPRFDKNAFMISTIDSYCSSLYTSLHGPSDLRLVDTLKERERDITDALNAVAARTADKKHRFFSADHSFWSDEFNWIKERDIRSLAEYENVERAGRSGGMRIFLRERALAWSIFEAYREEQKLHKHMDRADKFRYVLDHLGKLKPEQRFDHVLLDEGQDLSLIKLKLIRALATDSITIAADKAQKIYNTSFAWKDIGIDIRGSGNRSLSKSFRSTKQIVQLAESLNMINRLNREGSNEYTDPVIPEREGPVPKVFSCSSALAERSVFLSLVQKHLSNKETICIPYRTRIQKSSIENWLVSAKIGYQEISKETVWSAVAPGVKLCTFHSTKGLEFDTVVIPFVSDKVLPLDYALRQCEEDQRLQIVCDERCLLYVGMTRAKTYLYLTTSGTPSQFISEFDPQFYDLLDEQGKEKKKNYAGIRLSKDEAPSSGLTAQPGSTIQLMDSNGQMRSFVLDPVERPFQQDWIGKRQGDSVRLADKTTARILNLTKPDLSLLSSPKSMQFGVSSLATEKKTAAAVLPPVPVLPPVISQEKKAVSAPVKPAQPVVKKQDPISPSVVTASDVRHHERPVVSVPRSVGSDNVEDIIIYLLDRAPDGLSFNELICDGDLRGKSRLVMKAIWDMSGKGIIDARSVSGPDGNKNAIITLKKSTGSK